MWTYRNMPFTADMIGNNVGFVYLIWNVTKKKWYVGQKLFTKSKRYQKKGRRRSKRVGSDWESYTGSSDALNADIAAGDTIEKMIIYLCESKGWMNYHETREIMIRNALIDDSSYNTWCYARIRRSHLTGKRRVKEEAYV